MKATLAAFALMFFLHSASAMGADAVKERMRGKYPSEDYIVGVGRVALSEGYDKDRRKAEIMARLDIAKHIGVRIRQLIVDVMCDEGRPGVFDDAGECKDEFLMVVEETVDEFLRGTEIVEHGEEEGRVFAVAVMPKEEAVDRLNRGIEDSLAKAEAEMDKARAGDAGAAASAKEEYLKALAYEKEKEVVSGARGRASEALERLDRELGALKDKRAEQGRSVR